MAFKLNYQRSRKPDLEKMMKQYESSKSEDESTYDYNPFRIAGLQSYNPIYNVFFNMDANTCQKITLNHKYLVTSLDSVVDAKNASLNTPIFVKSSPLLDPLHFLRGKYNLENPLMTQLPQLDSNPENCFPKLVDVNNSAYVDGFFSYLTSMMHETHGWIHGVQYYGSFLGVQSRFRYNIADDIDFLEESDYFLNNIGKYFDLDEDVLCVFNEKKGSGSRRNRDKLEIMFENDVQIDSIDLGIEDLECEPVQTQPIESVDHMYELFPVKTGEDKPTIPVSQIEETQRSRSSSSSSSDSSSISVSTVDEDELVCSNCECRVVLSKYISRVGGKPYCKACIKDVEPGDQSSISDDDDDDDDDDETEYTDCSDEDFDEDEEETMFAYLHNFPVQLIFQEKCFGTFDELLMNKKISSKEIIASLFQITIILATYQKLFNFTHNDLHTNNIMYVKTDIEHIEYKLNNTIYRIPTYGRIFKLIDFGRAIYQFNGHQFCSDSFAENGDANSQYNCEPYLNPKKPRIDPNPSFDLCRLGCSLYDFTMDTDSKELKTLVDEWCEDDYGKNILYKSSGEERYPGFKLYKMIARIVNNLVPLDILSRKPIFSRFAISAPTAGATFIDIDEMPIYVNAAAPK